MNTLKKLVLSGSTLFLLAACGGETEDPAVDEMPEDTTEQTEEDATDVITADDLEFYTVDEIAEYDGQDGSQALIAVGDVVYDVTDANGWEDGVHEGGIEAGNVYDEEDFEAGPHGTEVLDNVPTVGTVDHGE